MNKTSKAVVAIACSAAMCLSGLCFVPECHAAGKSGQAQERATAASRALGTVTVIAGNALTLKTDEGAEIKVVIPISARIVRTEPGQKSLAGAAPIHLQELQTGDRMLVKGALSEDGKSFAASLIVVMKKADIAEKQAREREDWQKRGVGGRITGVDPAAEIITIATNGTNGSRVVSVHVSKSTILRRYAPNSVKFDDAKVTTIDQIKAGDQLRARGDRTGTDVQAEEIVEGTFLSIAGTVISADAARNEFTVTDLATKKPVLVKLTADSQFHKLPPMMAEMIALRLKGGATQAQAQHGWAGQLQHPQAAKGAAAGQHDGPADINQMLARLPELTVSDLHKGDAVMIVAQGTAEKATAVTLLSGVEPILTASPKGDAAMMLSPWNLGGGGEGGEGGQASPE